jgi:lipopolysaccharide transport system ATP-binding protein
VLSTPAIVARDLVKTYRLYSHPADRVKEAFHPFRRKYHQRFNALNGVSFAVEKGRTLGVVGRNGSGKSTLLQILCGTTAPTGGSLRVQGSVAGLLELGAGFHPDFTGRQNVYTNGAILGFSRDEMDARIERIEAFAEIGAFIDQPVKTYSSGMHVRLGFAVAVHMEPDILVVDEALAVGDEAFQRKCYARIQDFKKRGGTLVFVSHSPMAVVELCDRALLLDRGEVLYRGEPKETVANYHKLLFAPPERVDPVRDQIRSGNGEGRAGKSDERAPSASTSKERPSPAGDAPGEGYDAGLVPKSTVWYESRGALIDSPCITTPQGKKVNVLVRDCSYLYTFRIRFLADALRVRWGGMIKTVSGFELGGIQSSPPGQGIERVQTGTLLRAELPFRCCLLPGTYFFNCGVTSFVEGAETYLHRGIDAVMFRVRPEAGLQVTGPVDFGAAGGLPAAGGPCVPGAE